MFLAFALAIAVAWGLPAVAMAADGGDPVGNFAKGLQMRTEPGQMPDFVVKSRPPADSLQYLPNAGSRTQPGSTALSSEAIKARESELDAALARHNKLSGRKPGQQANSAAGVPDKAKQRTPAPCVLTCVIK